MQEEVPLLPEKKRRTPIIYAVVYNDAEGKLMIEEFEDRPSVKRFVNELADPDMAQVVYRVSHKIKMKKKVVVSF